MKIRHAWFAFVVAVSASGVPVGCSGGVVGGECRRGFGPCGGQCLDLRSDSENCGACGHVCGAFETCGNGVCASTDGGGNGGAASLDASTGTGGVSSGSGGLANTGGASAGGRDAATSDGASGAGAGGVANGTGGQGGATGGGGSAGATGGGGTAGAGGIGSDAGNCDPPFNTAAHCGDCQTACSGATPLCSYNDGFRCWPFCEQPLTQCGNECVNTDNDENNCGRCNHRCASGICQGGQCVGATAGHEVMACMDYRTREAVGTPEEQILENAIFLGSKANVRILEYTQYSLPAVVTAVGHTLDAAATNRKRTYTITVAATSADVANKLSIFDFEVLLVLDQPNAPAGTLASNGAAWASGVNSFVRAGGTAVVLAGDGGRAEMGALLSSAGLLSVTGQTSVTGNQVYDRAPGDAIGLNVISPFRAPRETCTFTVPAPDDTTTFVVTDAPSSSGGLGSPIVVHRVLSP